MTAASGSWTRFRPTLCEIPGRLPRRHDDRTRQPLRVAPVVDPAHGPRFVRAALHLRHRAGRHGVRVGPGLVFDARGRGLSHANAYRAALGDEPVRMARAAIRDVLATPLPEPFARLWADDVEVPPPPRTSAEPWPNNRPTQPPTDPDGIASPCPREETP